MHLRKMVEADRMLKELNKMGFTESRDRRPLHRLGYDDLCREYVRLPELRELEEMQK